jgi:hypothetical protein
MAKTKRGPSEAERAERRARDRDRLQQAARELLTSDGRQRWVRARALFHNYSLRNCLLLAAQCRERGIDARRVVGFRAWLRLGRYRESCVLSVAWLELRRRYVVLRSAGRRGGCGRVAPRWIPLRQPTLRASPSHAGRLPPQVPWACSSREPTAGARAASRHGSERPHRCRGTRGGRVRCRGGSQSVCGRVPISTKSASAATVSSLPTELSRSTSCRSRPSPPPPTTVVLVRTSMPGVAWISCMR